MLLQKLKFLQFNSIFNTIKDINNFCKNINDICSDINDIFLIYNILQWTFCNEITNICNNKLL